MLEAVRVVRYFPLTLAANFYSCISSTASTAATTGTAGDASQKPTTGAGSREAPSSFGAFALPRPDARAKMLAQRTVTVQDLMVALRFDRSRAGWGRMRRSRVVARTFGLRFRE